MNVAAGERVRGNAIVLGAGASLLTFAIACGIAWLIVEGVDEAAAAGPSMLRMVGTINGAMPFVAMFVPPLVGGYVAGLRARQSGALHGAAAEALKLLVLWLPFAIENGLASGIGGGALAWGAIAVVLAQSALTGHLAVRRNAGRRSR